MKTVSMLLRYYMRTSFKAICNVNQITLELGSWESIKSSLTYVFCFQPTNSVFSFFLPQLPYHRDAGERSLWMTLCLSMRRIICYYQLQPVKLNFGRCCCPKLSLSWQILGMFGQLTFSLFCEVTWNLQKVVLIYMGNVFC